jgi:ADP-ribosylglycohydrolase
MEEISIQDRMLGGLWGAVVGDALGVPVEFKGRDVRKGDPVTDMRGYGTFDLPPGSWSDDSSLMLCTAQGLLDGFDTERIGDLFVSWFTAGLWTPHGQAFDVGRGTWQAISRMQLGAPAETAGGLEEENNGNGSLMRILPAALYCAAMDDEEALGLVHRASAITHGHPRSMMACGMYYLMVASVLNGMPPREVYRLAMEKTERLYDTPPFSDESPHFSRLLSGNIHTLPEDAIESDGYVVHTLEASLWCLLTTDSYRSAVLKAVNLGWDTDTTAIVTGGLAGTHYGLKAIPQHWRDILVRKQEIEALLERFVEKTVDE